MFTLLLLCTVQFMDIIDSSIMNVALPSIRNDLGFSQQRLQWVLSGYLVTYGGFLLLGGRAADLIGRRRLLVAGTTLFAVCSLAGGLATNAGMLVGARVAQGVGAALMAPAGLSILTTTFTEGKDRTRALGVWGAISGVAAAAGVFLGGVLSQGPGWRWVLFVNIPVCVLIVAAALRLVPGERRRARPASFDVPGAVLVTGGMLLLVYALVKAPDAGWRHQAHDRRTRHRRRPARRVRHHRSAHPQPAVPVRHLPRQRPGRRRRHPVDRLRRLPVGVLLPHPLHAERARLHPDPQRLRVPARHRRHHPRRRMSSQLIPRVGTRPIIVAGTLIAAAGMYYLSRIPAHGSYLTDLLPGLAVMSIGLGAVFVTVTTAANAGVPAHQAGLAAGLLNTSLQLGSALGLAVFSAIATAHTNHLLADHTAPPQALTAGFAAGTARRQHRPARRRRHRPARHQHPRPHTTARPRTRRRHRRRPAPVPAE